jgi:hypothetical protein
MDKNKINSNNWKKYLITFLIFIMLILFFHTLYVLWYSHQYNQRKINNQLINKNNFYNINTMPTVTNTIQTPITYSYGNCNDMNTYKNIPGFDIKTECENRNLCYYMNDKCDYINKVTDLKNNNLNRCELINLNIDNNGTGIETNNMSKNTTEKMNNYYLQCVLGSTQDTFVFNTVSFNNRCNPNDKECNLLPDDNKYLKYSNGIFSDNIFVNSNLPETGNIYFRNIKNSDNIVVSVPYNIRENEKIQSSGNTQLIQPNIQLLKQSQQSISDTNYILDNIIQFQPV